MWISNLPSIITAGTTIEWVDDATTAGINKNIFAPDWTLEYYLRTNKYDQAHTATGIQYQNSTGWEFVINANQSSNFAAGDWFWAARAFNSGNVFEIGTGQLEVKKSLQYSGTANGIDNRTQTEIDYDTVTAAIRAISTDMAAEYSIGNRTFKRVDLAELRKLQSQLAARKFSEKRSSLIKQGLGDPKNLFVRF